MTEESKKPEDSLSSDNSFSMSDGSLYIDMSDLTYYTSMPSASYGSFSIPLTTGYVNTYSTGSGYNLYLSDGSSMPFTEVEQILRDHKHLMDLVGRFPTVEYHYNTLQAMIKLHTNEDAEPESD